MPHTQHELTCLQMARPSKILHLTNRDSCCVSPVTIPYFAIPDEGFSFLKEMVGLSGFPVKILLKITFS